MFSKICSCVTTAGASSIDIAVLERIRSKLFAVILHNTNVLLAISRLQNYLFSQSLSNLVDSYSPELVVKTEDRLRGRVSSGRNGEDGRRARPLRDRRTLARR